MAHADQTAPGTALARIAKVNAALEKKGLGGAVIEIKPLAPASNPMHLKQVEVTLMVTN